MRCSSHNQVRNKRDNGVQRQEEGWGSKKKKQFTFNMQLQQLPLETAFCHALLAKSPASSSSLEFVSNASSRLEPSPLLSLAPK
ncbi:hypothetical protein OIU84_008154 [Salix udensis]|uniref:Uncharacterized protein n=1 Tax=Salix udensis TaxID=889485 RepID=A0AAD6P081_9ROSI|nr:hypothetical protein OIU84_008154 [Salix udensis]